MTYWLSIELGEIIIETVILITYQISLGWSMRQAFLRQIKIKSNYYWLDYYLLYCCCCCTAVHHLSRLGKHTLYSQSDTIKLLQLGLNNHNGCWMSRDSRPRYRKIGKVRPVEDWRNCYLIDIVDWLAGFSSSSQHQHCSTLLCSGCQKFNFPSLRDRFVYIISVLQYLNVYHHHNY